MTKRERDALAGAIATFEAFADLEFTEAKILVTADDGQQINGTLSPEILQLLWRSLSDAAIKHIKNQMAEYEATIATMN